MSETKTTETINSFASFVALSANNFSRFGDLINDHNPLHRDISYALGKKCESTPVFGIALGALAEISIKDAQDEIFSVQFSGRHITSGIAFKFIEPVYADREVVLGDGSLSFHSFKCKAKSQGKDVFSAEINFGQEYPTFISPESNSLIDYRQEITREQTAEFYDLLGIPLRKEISPLQVAAQIPAALLEISRLRSGTVQGTSRGINLKFFSEPSPGKYRTEIRLISSKGNPEKGFIYNVHGLCYNSDRPVVEGTFTVLHPCDLRQL